MSKPRQDKRPCTKGLRLFSVHLGTFDFTVNAVVGDAAAAIAWVRWKHEDPAIEDTPWLARGRYYARDGYCPIIWLPRVPRTPREIGTLAHEALHVVHLAMRWAGVPLELGSEETYTHCVAWIVASLLTQMRKRPTGAKP